MGFGTWVKLGSFRGLLNSSKLYTNCSTCTYVLLSITGSQSSLWHTFSLPPKRAKRKVVKVERKQRLLMVQLLEQQQQKKKVKRKTWRSNEGNNWTAVLP